MSLPTTATTGFFLGIYYYHGDTLIAKLSDAITFSLYPVVYIPSSDTLVMHLFRYSTKLNNKRRGVKKKIQYRVLLKKKKNNNFKLHPLEQKKKTTLF